MAEITVGTAPAVKAEKPVSLFQELAAAAVANPGQWVSLTSETAKNAHNSVANHVARLLGVQVIARDNTLYVMCPVDIND